MRSRHLLHFVFFLFSGLIVSNAVAQETDSVRRVSIPLDSIGVVVPDSGVSDGATSFLGKELSSRFGADWTAAPPAAAKLRLHFATVDEIDSLDGSTPNSIEIPDTAEAYALWTSKGSDDSVTVNLLGYDARGLLYATGRLLRSIGFRAGAISIPAELAVSTAPAYPIRGHQIGYRNTANSYDKWNVEQYDQYIRDLIAFGANSVELIPSLDPEEKDSVHMGLTMWEMTVALSGLLDSYGLDTWMWLPLDGDVSQDDVAAEELEARRALFEACPSITGVFVPGGDPGHTHPDLLMPWLGKMAEVLQASHPDAKVWVSNQGFKPDENDAFFQYIEEKRPTWLGGVVFGPWVKLSLDEMRALTPEDYPIRRYPDIAHCVRCQYPVVRWDRAFAHTLGREPFNPRPKAMRTIHNLYAAKSAGAITYSDGINDDVNKILWSMLGWDPETGSEEILLDYSRYFLSEEHAELAAKGLQGFEDVWVGPLSGHPGVEENLSRWETIARAESDALKHNWRLQLCLLRARYDAYVQRRLEFETGLEADALGVLGAATADSAPGALLKAKLVLHRADNQPEDLVKLREQLVQLGHDLWASIGMQLDVKNYQARNAERGAILEFLDTPLNDRVWLDAEIDRAASIANPEERLDAISEIVHWDKPGAGSFYDDLGNASRQPHLVVQRPWDEDPSRVHSPQEEYSKGTGMRLSWMDQGQTLYGTPLRMQYTELDPDATYDLKVTYAGRFRATTRLVANGDVEIHGPLPQPNPIAPVTFSLDKSLTSSGTLDLSWELLDGRGVQVAEVWLLRRGDSLNSP